MISQSKTAAISMAVLSTLCMATSAVLFTWTNLPADTVVFFRMLIGFLILSVFFRLTGSSKGNRINISATSICGGISLSTMFVLYMESLNHLTISVAIMTVYLGPVIASLVAHFIFKEYLTLFRTLMISGSFIGFALLQQLSPWQSETPTGFGLILGTGAALSYSAFILINRAPVAPERHRSHILTQLLAGALILTPLVSNQSFSLNAQQWLGVTLTGLIPGALGIMLAVKALQRLEVSQFNALSYVEPVVLTLTGWAFYAETLSLAQGAGMMMITGCGVALVFASSGTNHKNILREEAPISPDIFTKQ